MRSSSEMRIACGLLASFFSLAGCGKRNGDIPKPASPAKVEMVPNESNLATITLTPEADSRLGITTIPVEHRTVQRRRTFGGEVIVPSGRSIVISAPVSGIIKAMNPSGLPIPGTLLQAGDIVLTIAPLLSPERDVPTPAEQVQMVSANATLVAAQVTAMGDVQRGRADVVAAKITLDRAQKLFTDRAGSQRAVDDAQALANVAQTILTAAEERHEQLTTLIGTLKNKSGSDPAEELTIRAPVKGIVRSLNVSLGQQVVGGSAIFEVLDASVVWVRVPVFVDLLPSIQQEASGIVTSTNNRKSPGSEVVRAIPVRAPPTADASSSSVDLYFEVSNSKMQFRPGQRVGINLPVSEELQADVIPTSSVIYDIHGGAWIYCAMSPQKYQRKRIDVLWFDEDVAVVQPGIPSGTNVVTQGAAELFGTEFGAGK